MCGDIAGEGPRLEWGYSGALGLPLGRVEMSLGVEQEEFLVLGVWFFLVKKDVESEFVAVKDGTLEGTGASVLPGKSGS